MRKTDINKVSKLNILLQGDRYHRNKPGKQNRNCGKGLHFLAGWQWRPYWEVDIWAKASMRWKRSKSCGFHGEECLKQERANTKALMPEHVWCGGGTVRKLEWLEWSECRMQVGDMVIMMNWNIHALEDKDYSLYSDSNRSHWRILSQGAKWSDLYFIEKIGCSGQG